MSFAYLYNKHIKTAPLKNINGIFLNINIYLKNLIIKPAELKLFFPLKTAGIL